MPRCLGPTTGPGFNTGAVVVEKVSCSATSALLPTNVVPSCISGLMNSEMILNLPFFPSSSKPYLLGLLDVLLWRWTRHHHFMRSYQLKTEHFIGIWTKIQFHWGHTKFRIVNKCTLPYYCSHCQLAMFYYFGIVVNYRQSQDQALHCEMGSIKKAHRHWFT